MGSREKVQADFDLERFIDMFDEALTSNDERVVNALRSLMMMVILTKPEARNEGHDMNRGPLRQLFEDLHQLNRNMHDVSERLRKIESRYYREEKVTTEDYWNTSRQYNWREVTQLPTISDEDYKRAMVSVATKINTPGKL